jgi:RNA polymerase subunit RPABC4/transcription elongation factor Spt4
VKLSDTYNLKALFPDLARQWHPTKNNNLTPDRVKPNSNKKVWWTCDKGHEWQAQISSRNNGSGCPYCSGNKASKETSLSTNRPDLAKQWHPTKNGSLTPDKVTPSSEKIAWWICDKGHEWKIAIASRIFYNSDCPYCSHRKASKEYNLLIVNPGIAKQWHPFKNGELTPDKVTPRSTKKVWWVCDKGHEWKALILNRTRGTGCPKCASTTATREHNLLIVNPGIAAQWHPDKNGDLRPDKVSPVSRRKVWWLCDNGHEWKDIIKERTRGNKCPYCFGMESIKEYNLSSFHPDLAKQWHPTKNGKLTPDDVTPFSNKKVWWGCDKGHEWKARITDRNHGSGCPYCAGTKVTKEYNLLVLHPDIAKQWHPTKNGNLTPAKVMPYSLEKAWWMCDKGHEWITTIAYRSYGTGCPYCAVNKHKRENAAGA